MVLIWAAAAICTDFLDGYLARRLDQRSDFGRILDPIADKVLVTALESDTLAVRVLSFWNLKDLTGLGLFYRPEQTEVKRQTPIKTWRRRLDAGEIRLRTPAEKADAAAEEKVAPPAKEPGS